MWTKYTPKYTGPVTPEELMARWMEYMLVKCGGVTISWTTLNGGK